MGPEAPAPNLTGQSQHLTGQLYGFRKLWLGKVDFRRKKRSTAIKNEPGMKA
jgi:hypothetical protein